MHRRGWRNWRHCPSYLDYAKDNHYDRETTVEVVDINAQMLKEGYKRFKQTMYHNSRATLGLFMLPLYTDVRMQHRRYLFMKPMRKT